MQDLGYVAAQLKYYSGETKTLPHVILTAKYSNVISSYMQRCSES